MGEKIIANAHKHLPNIGLRAFLLSLKNPIWTEGSLFDILEKVCLKNIFQDSDVGQNPMISGFIYELVKSKRSHLLNFMEKQMDENGIFVAYKNVLDSVRE